MNQHLKTIQDLLQQNKTLSDAEKETLLKTITDADKQWSITDFKLDRTEKVKKTTAILLEETIEELEQKRKAVEAQNHELAIESSLERVRTVAMSMMKPDDLLNICKAQFTELKQLGFSDIRNALIGIFHDDKNYVGDYDYSDFSGGSITNIPYGKNAIVDRSLAQLKSAKDAFTEFIVEGKDLEEWKAFRKQNGEYDDSRIETAYALYYYFYSIGSGNIGISTFQKISDEQLAILKRFRNVFDLAYRRYVDISNAAVQAKEARIETALERVRAVAMAMKQSDELVAVSEVMYKELTSLGFSNIRNAQIAIENDERQSFISYVHSDQEPHAIREAPYSSSSLLLKAKQQLSTSGAFYETEYSGKELDDWRDWKKRTGAPLDSRELTAASLRWYLYSIGKGHIGISTFDEISAEQVEIVKRFKNVFELSYRRFDDLQKAEAQAKEAQIEAALERVRSRSMAMQKSEELKEVIQVVYEQFVNLNMLVEHTGFIMDYKERNDMHIWLADKHAVPFQVTIPYFDCPHWNSFNEAKAKGRDFFTNHLNFEEKNKFYRELFGLFPVPDETKEYYFGCPGLAISTVLLDNVGLYIENFSGIPYTNEENNTLLRFGKVFQQTYTRFLDLQKAEAQAREAKIEAALEKVRSRSLAVHQSEEFKEVIRVVFEKLKELEIPVEAASINIFGEGSKDTDVYACGHNENGLDIRKVRLRYFDHPIANDLYNAHKNGLDFFVGSYGMKEKNSYYEYQFKHADLKELPDEIKERILQAERYSLSMAPAKNSVIIINNFEGKLLSDTEADIVRRFSRVFEQAYTRFLDLQKAEAQARESQIQLALERVRARTMAMQHSDELREAAALLFQQVKSLGVPAYSCGYNIWEKDDKEFTSWMSTQDGSDFNAVLNIPLTVDANFIRFAESRKKGEQFFVLELRGKRMQEHYQYLKTIPAFKAYFDYAVSVGFDLPETQIHHLANFSQGNLLFITLEPCPEFHDVFKRFAAVFEQTYTRFLDLQKAEAQARESKIELGLERVRARAMAMQSSNELSDLVDTVFKELTKLDFALNWCMINIIDVSTMSNMVWAANPDTQKTPDSYYMKFEDYPFHDVMMKGYKERKTKYIYVIEGNEKKIYDEYLFKETAFRKVPEEAQAASRAMEKYVCSFTFSNFGGLQTVGTEPLSDINLDILERFGKVFDLTYTRFNDLLKSEAQARESQIQLALERVRARTMAMQKSDELREAVLVLYEQLQQLDFNSNACNIIIVDKETSNAQYWVSGFSQETFPQSYSVPYFNHPYQDALIKPWEGGDKYVVYEYAGKTKQSFDKIFFTQTEFRNVPEDAKKVMIELKSVTLSTAFMSYGALQSLGAAPLSGENANILQRFAKVFEQTYTRFLDLQKAEAQAKEARIEAALERTRTQSMIMQHSKELDNTLRVFHEQILSLGIQSEFSYLWLPDEDKDRHIFWAAWAENLSTGQPDKNNSIVFKSKAVNYPLDRTEPATAQCLVDWKSEESIYSYVIPPTGVENYFATWKELLEGVERLKPAYFPDGLYYVEAFMKYGCFGVVIKKELLDDEKKILLRFSIEFERTYTRFLDLQKAEGQAREAQIEAALEKIRSRSLAMHQSDELEEVIMVVSEQLQQLQFRFHNASFVRYNEQQGLNFWLASPGQPQPYLIEVPYLDNPIYTRPLEALKNGVDFIADVLTAEENHEWVAHLLKYSVLKNVSEDDKKFLRGTTGFARSLVLTKHIILVIGNYGAVPYTDEQNQILKRFGYVFEQAYTRFLDLLKAEAQTREAQIELGLERVRARAMAMQNSVELKELIGTVFIELTKLDIVLTRCVIMIYDTVSNDSVWWMANSEAPADPIGLHIKYHDHAPYLAYINAWREKNLKWTYVLEGADKKSWDEFLFAETELSHLPDFVIDGMKAPDRVYLNSSFNTFGNLTLASLDPLSNEHFDIMLRFAKVFDLTYTRFNDLQKAEAQAKESQIEAALERVRSRSMAMHKSEELADLSLELVKQVQALGVATWFCAFNIYDNDPQGSLEWGSNGQGTFPKYRTPREAIFLRYYEAGQKGETLLINEIGENECPAHYDYLCTLPGVGEQLLKMKESGIPFPVSQIDHVAFFKYGYILFITYEPTPESHDIFKRFAKVFEQTYTRFLDLQKAEAQVKESQIEAALERVRSKTMAMHKTDELQGVVRVVAEELKNTGVILDTGGAVICTYFQDSKDVIHWTATEDPAHPSVPYLLPYFKDELFDEAWASKNSGDDYFAKEFSYEVKNAFFNYAFEHSDYGQLPDEYKKIMLESKSHGLAWAWSKNSAIMIPSIQGDLPSEEEKEILVRFAKVFEQSFIRFLDLQKAEAQTREATIEAALERVRGKAMAMHSSKDLATTIGVFYHELEALNLTPRRCGVGLIDKEKQTAEISTMNASADGEGIELVGNLDLRSHPVLTSVYNNWLTKTEYHPVLRGNEIKDYYQIVRPQISFPDYPNDTVQYGYFFFFEEGGVYAWTEKELNEEELKIYRRFTSVLSLTYKRYKDLKDAEVRAQTAIKDAALDRIRADIASMRTINDLDRITPLIWNELTVLGIPFIRCGVFIMDEDQELIHTFLSTPDGRSIAAFHLPYDTPGNIGKVLDHWRNKENYIDHWDEKEFHQFAEILAKQGALDSAENYLKTIPHGGFALHFLPFLQGMLYVGNTTQLNDEQIELIQHVANAFSTAYARYEDFNKLEAAKQQVDKTLVELKQAQTQLVQSEKMASLGELTAGIAHEIQNPLNFVNNFSDVSHELLDEMKTELEKGNKEDAMAIAEDVKQNLEKILHHGKRADAIVKGMLQHSRAGSGQKELTDINALADEYLRLAYHGLRAKDKSFNAALHHDFDKSIDKVNIIPQDIGRVLVNLINNAFYAVNVKARKNIPGYEPALTITTKKIADKVELRVSDNGVGIPPKVLDKIFHPFFTTKPTGQGTGLGLSMAYDIITKGHGGELKVKTKEGEGSEFCIQIPLSKTPA